MNHQVYEYQTIVENYIASRQKPIMVVRNVGPKNIVDEDKKTQVYDTYRMLLSRDIMHGILNHEIIFVEFDTVENAETYAVDHFPKNSSDGDPDFYILVEVYDDQGRIEYHNK